MTTPKALSGLIIRNHKVLDAESKEHASKSLTGWKQDTLTPADWVSQLSAGHTIQPSEFSPKDDKGTFTHALKYWKSTQFVCADADNIKGVETLDDGTEANPNGVEAFTDPKGLKQFETLEDKVYAVGQSVSSMSDSKPPKHRRYRLIFLFDAPIESIEHYKQVLSALISEFPIISLPKRSPVQPVFGNARKGYNQVYLCDNVLSLADYPYTPSAEVKSKAQPLFDTVDTTALDFISPDSDYDTWLKVGLACYHSDVGLTVWDSWSRKSSKYKEGETQKKWDGFGDYTGPKVTWGTVVELAKDKGYKPKGNGSVATPNPKKSNCVIQDNAVEKEEPAPRDMLSALPPDEHSKPEFPDYDGELFIGAFQNLYLAYADTHVWSPEMIMAFGIGSLSYVAGRHVTVQTHEDTKPEPLNSYILAVGESDLTAKSEAVRELKKHVTHCDDDFAPISNAQSLEGILKALGENDQASQYVVLDESSVVFTNSRREGTKNILGGLNELWVCPKNYTTVRAGEKARVDDPYLNCWGNIPTELIPSVFRQEDLVAGTLNRWLPFYITPKTKTERSPHAVTDFYDMWIKRLKSVYSAYGTDRRLIFETEADDARFNWYDTLRQNAIKGGTQTGESRFHTHAVKLSGLFALADNPIDNDNVTIEHWKTALGVIRYLFQCYEYLFRNIGSTRLGDIENKILDMLNRNSNEMTLTELGRKVRGTDSTERERVIEALEKHGVVIRFREETDGRYTTKIRRVG